MDRNTELRKIDIGSKNEIIDILEINQDWQKFMCKIPKDPDSEVFEPKYNTEHMRLIKEHAERTRSKCSKVLLEEWESSGRKRPTLKILLQLLDKEKMFRAADCITKMIREPSPERPLDGPGRRIPLNVTELLNTREGQSIGQLSTAQMQSNNNKYSEEFQIPDLQILDPKSDLMVGASGYSNNSSVQSSSSESYSTYHKVDRSILEDSNLCHFDYNEIVRITQDFRHHVGSGGFGDVYIGIHASHGLLAIKKARIQELPGLKMDIFVLFNREVRALSVLRHENIVSILGIALNGPAPCVVCKYIDGGNLTQKIAEKVLTESEGMNIIIGVAEGLKYIHSSEIPLENTENEFSNKKYYFLHGDVKSANILLTKDYVPKLCDFGLSKQFTSTIYTRNLMGTSAYIAPECLEGIVTQKADVYSFGVVLLELITGLTPLLKTPNGTDNIKSYVEVTYHDDIVSVLGPSAVWDKNKATELYKMIKRCWLKDKEKRPSMEKICDELKNIKNSGTC